MQTKMKLLSVVGVLALLVAVAPVGAQGLPGYTYLPTADEKDGRMLAIAGAGLATIGGSTVELKLQVPSAASHFQIGIFDGDSGKNVAGVPGDWANGHWDLGSDELVYALYADPAGDGTGTTVIGSWSANATNPTSGPLWSTQVGGSPSGDMPNNGWFDITVTTSAAALGPNGYVYRMRVTDVAPAGTAESAFKVRSTALLSIPRNTTFGFVAQLRSLQDAATIYPSWPSLTPTTYDGTFSFFFRVPAPTPFIALWDGDMDHGSRDLVAKDTDDPDTPNDALPPWVNPLYTNLEGVAVGLSVPGGVATGNPPDENTGVPPFARPPSIVYDLRAPGGATYANTNPSGNSEWEQFRIDSDSGAAADYHVAGPLPGGLYEIRMRGLDMGNINLLRFSYDATSAPLPYLVGDRVWLDTDGDGVQEAGEAGIAGVKVILLDGAGNVIGEATTRTVDENVEGDVNGDGLLAVLDGWYQFPVWPGTYTVQVTLANFLPGGALFGYGPTVDYTGDDVGDNQRTQTVVDANLLTYDFGYNTGGQSTVSLGDTVWLDLDLDGLGPDDGDTGEPGINGVDLTLYIDFDGDGVINPATETWGTTTTDSSGFYQFQGLLPGYKYYVEVDTATLPAGLTQNWDLDDGDGPFATPDASWVYKNDVLTTDEDEADFGYHFSGQVGSLGDTVWYDADADGYQDSTERGISGVTLTLAADINGFQFTLSATTDGNGHYSFDSLPVGDNVEYTVTVDATNFEPGGALEGCQLVSEGSQDAADDTPLDGVLDGFTSVPSGNGAYLPLTGNEPRVDFGYRTTNEEICFPLLAADGQDAMIQFKKKNSNFGTSPVLMTDSEEAAKGPIRSLLQFDLSSIPAGAEITKAQLALYLFKNSGSQTDVVEAHRVTQAWVEAGVTWNKRNSTSSWTPGGAYDSAVEGSFVASGTGWKTMDLINLLQAWVDGTAPNYGLILLSPPAAGNNEKSYHSGEAADANLRPRLNICYRMPFLASLGDRVWEDFDRNGVQDQGEPGVEGVSVELYNANGDLVDSTTTDADGLYHFTDLLPGQYYVQFIPPAGYSISPSGQGGDPAKDSDANPADGKTGIITLESGENDLTWDAGIYNPDRAALGDYVWDDLNQNGVQDDGNTGLNGVVVELLDSNGNVLQTTTTTNNPVGGQPGWYLFRLDAGTYRVRLAASNFQSGGALYGRTVTLKDQGNDALDSDADPQTKTTEPVQVGVGQTRLDVDFGVYYLCYGTCAEGKPEVLIMRYTGEDCSASQTTQDACKWTCSGNPGFASPVRIVASSGAGGTGSVWYDGIVTLNGTYDIDAKRAGATQLPTNTYITVYSLGGSILQSIMVHTSCSQPLNVGDQWGSAKLLQFIPVGGLKCDTGSTGSNVCANGKPKVLTMQYTGQDCSASRHSQAAGKVICSGDPAYASPVYIIATNGGSSKYFEGLVSLNGTFNIDATKAGATALATNTYVTIYKDASKTVVLQSVTFHTSCSQPLLVGDQYGSLKLVGFVSGGK